MTGELKIKIMDGSARVTGHLENADFLHRIFIVDALMSSFKMTGPLRALGCKCLMYSDTKRSEPSGTDALESLIKIIEEATNEGRRI